MFAHFVGHFLPYECFAYQPPDKAKTNIPKNIQPTPIRPDLVRNMANINKIISANGFGGSPAPVWCAGPPRHLSVIQIRQGEAISQIQPCQPPFV